MREYLVENKSFGFRADTYSVFAPHCVQQSRSNYQVGICACYRSIMSEYAKIQSCDA